MKKFNPRLLKAAVYGANDGMVTTFAVVAGASGAHLSSNVVMVLGMSNLVADGISMALGDFLGERSEAKLRAKQKDKALPEKLWHTGVITFLAFAIAGSLPILPYFVKAFGFDGFFEHEFLFSFAMTFGAMFFIGSIRTYFIGGRWWQNGLEMLFLGAIASMAAYLLGAGVESLIT